MKGLLSVGKKVLVIGAFVKRNFAVHFLVKTDLNLDEIAKVPCQEKSFLRFDC